MKRRFFGLDRAASLVVLCLSLAGCARPVQNSPKENAAPVASVGAQLVGHIWRVEQPASGFIGTIYIFVTDGTLLETSCKETYRIAKWADDAKSARSFQVVEDGQPSFTGTILESNGGGLRLERRLRHGETEELKLTAVGDEFVCPDLR